MTLEQAGFGEQAGFSEQTGFGEQNDSELNADLNGSEPEDFVLREGFIDLGAEGTDERASETRTRSATERIAELAAKRKIRLIGTDYDGTIFGGAVTHDDAARLIVDVAKSGTSIVVATMRDASIRIEVPRILELLEGSWEGSGRIFFGTANGSSLYELRPQGLEVVYIEELVVAEVERIVEAYYSLSLEAHPHALAWLQEKHARDWSSLLEEEHLHLSRKHVGVWVERSSVVLALPSEPEEHERMLAKLGELLDDYHIAGAGSLVLGVTRRLALDPKLYALVRVMEILGIDDFDETAGFGDSPDENDYALTRVVNGFTNNEGYDGDAPPYFLGPETGLADPTERVHWAIRRLAVLDDQVDSGDIVN